MTQLATVSLEYDGRRIVCVTTIPPDAHHAGLAGIRMRQTLLQPADGLDHTSALSIGTLVREAAGRLEREALGAWDGTLNLFESR